MPYVEIAPVDSRLKPFIDCFWISQFANQAPKRIAPDGCFDLIYSLSGNSNPTTLIIVGTMTRWSLATPGSETLGIRFRPGGIYPFLNAPLHEFTDLTVPLNDVVPSLGTSFQQRVQETHDWAVRLLLVEQWLIETLQKHDGRRLPMLSVAAYLTGRHGLVSVERLSGQANLSRRQLERQFQQYVGISPKLLARIMRFQRVKTALKTKTDDSLMALAFDHGYTDHAHLTKDFKAFLGLTPSAYLAQ